MHHGPTAHYTHPHAHKYRRDLRARPSDPSPHRPKPQKGTSQEVTVMLDTDERPLILPKVGPAPHPTTKAQKRE